MWLLALTAQASEPTDLPPDPGALLPLEVQDEERWSQVDARAVRTARVGLVVTGVATGLSTAGLALVAAGAFGDDVARPLGFGLVTVGTAGTLVAAPVYLGAIGRSHRSLKERNVFSGTGFGAAAWTVLAAGLPLMPLFVVVPVAYPLWSTTVVALGSAQAFGNTRVRSEAGLRDVGSPWRVVVHPRPNGLSLSGAF